MIMKQGKRSLPPSFSIVRHLAACFLVFHSTRPDSKSYNHVIYKYSFFLCVRHKFMWCGAGSPTRRQTHLSLVFESDQHGLLSILQNSPQSFEACHRLLLELDQSSLGSFRLFFLFDVSLDALLLFRQITMRPGTRKLGREGLRLSVVTICVQQYPQQ